jgi:alanine dehydrogenase
MPLQTGIAGTSLKENEHRVPIHPAHLPRVRPELRSAITLETGYGEPFGFTDDDLTGGGYALAPRRSILRESELVILPKPTAADLEQLAEGAVLWGWPHCVQQRDITQVAIDRRLTLIAFEAMYRWSGETRGVHVFHRNNELAGYCAILDALRITGRDGAYGPDRRAVILSFGSVSRGAAHALLGRGFTDITAYTLRPPHLVRDQRFGVRYGRMRRAPAEGGAMRARPPGDEERPLTDVLAEADVIVNGTLQDPERPLMFLRDGEADRLKERALVVDVSCDEGMGFPFARPTSFSDPTFPVGRSATYYGVDHTPSYLWEAASWEISTALLPYLGTVLEGPDAWERNPTVDRAVEVRDGVVENPVVLSFQGRDETYPHTIRT